MKAGIGEKLRRKRSQEKAITVHQKVSLETRFRVRV